MQTGGIREKVKKALQSACQGYNNPRIELEENPPGQVGGMILSEAFEGLSPTERQDLIWRHLDEELTEDERTMVSFIVTDTPREYAVLTR
jgi:hypothetical protein